MGAPGMDRLQRQQDAAQMRALVQSEPWQCFERYLTLMREDAVRRVLDAGPDGFARAQGYYRGINDVLTLPERLIRAGQEGP